MILRPFPQTARRGESRRKLYTRYREDLTSLAGTAIFVFGNRLHKGTVGDAPGVEEEFDIAIRNGLTVIPIGATGYAARKFWERVTSDFDRYFPKAQGIKRPFARLGTEDADEDLIVSALLEILARLKGHQ